MKNSFLIIFMSVFLTTTIGHAQEVAKESQVAVIEVKAVTYESSDVKCETVYGLCVDKADKGITGTLIDSYMVADNSSGTEILVEKKLVEADYKNGYLNGSLREYYDNGAVWIESNFISGKINGVKKTFSDTGVITNESNFINNQLSGVSKNYYPSGRISWESMYLADKLNGSVKAYEDKDNGSMQYEALYVNDNKSGTEKYYENGNTFAEFIYDNNVLQAGKCYNTSNEATVIDDNGLLLYRARDIVPCNITKEDLALLLSSLMILDDTEQEVLDAIAVEVDNGTADVQVIEIEAEDTEGNKIEGTDVKAVDDQGNSVEVIELKETDTDGNSVKVINIEAEDTEGNSVEVIDTKAVDAEGNSVEVIEAQAVDSEGNVIEEEGAVKVLEAK